jgi:hypothetical protein
MELIEDAREGGWFPPWSNNHINRKKTSPLELMILGSLRYIGRGWTFDDLEEATGISQETHRSFFHVFICIGSTVLFRKYVVSPKNNEDAQTHMHEMKLAGLHGAVGSTDATHIVLEKCSNRLKNAHLGGKMKHAARTYNITVNHRRRILSTTTGHPSRWNDKTLVRFDKFVSGIHEGTILNDVEFSLWEKNHDGQVVEAKYKGAWLIVDNGYLNWAVTVPPLKVSSDQREIRWSQWMESIRKDVECMFGILKGRWRILKTGIRLFGVESADKIWMTCCALHNWLLEVDGLDEKWESGVPSEWEGELGDQDDEDIEHYGEPFALQRLHSPAARRQYDTSGIGVGKDGIMSDEEECNTTNTYSSDSSNEGTVYHESEGTVKEVRKLSLTFFRGRLIEHFDILYRDGKISWPRRKDK